MDCSCSICQGACKRKPGWFKPGEAEKVAEFLGISLKELFNNKLMVDYWLGEEDDEGGGHHKDIFVLSPATVDGKPGTVFLFNPNGQCVFYGEEGLCEIHPVKPFECREMMHDEDNAYLHKETADSWKDNKQIGELLGEKPDAGKENLIFPQALL